MKKRDTTGPQRDTRGIVGASELLGRVRFRRREPAAAPHGCCCDYRLHEALERAAAEDAVGRASLALELDYSDQARLARDFTATAGVPPCAYGR